MKLALARRLASHSAVGFAFASTTSGGDIPLPAIGAFAVVWASTLIFGERIGGGRNVLWTALTALALAGLAGLWFAGLLDLVVAASLFSAALAANRLLSRQSAADDGLLYLSALLMLAGGAALSADLAYGLCFAGFAFSVTAALALSHLSRAAEEAKSPEHLADRLASPRLMGGLAALSAVALLGAAVSFFLFPRATFGVYTRQRTRGAQTGFSGELRLEGHGALKGDARTMLKVRFRRGPAAPTLDLLWRGKAFDFFDGRGWRSTAPAGSARRNAVLREARPEDSWAEVEVLPEAGTTAIFTAGELVQIDPPSRLPPRASAPALVMVADAFDNRLVQPDPEQSYQYAFRFRPFELARLAGAGMDYPEPVRQHYLQLPTDLDPRVRELAQRLGAGPSDPLAKVRAIEQALRSGYEYSTELPGTVADPLAHFLFERKKGHCEYFSTALTVLLRAAGVPARNATGFFGGVRDEDGRYSIRGGDAHSWTEVYFPGFGFVPFDATPAEGRAARPSALASWAAQAWEKVSARWRVWVVDYSIWDQMRAARSAMGALTRGLERFEGKGGIQTGAMLRRVGALAIILGAVWLIRYLLRRPLKAQRQPPRRAQEADRLFRALQRRLKRRGIPRRPSQTARELAEEAGRRLGPDASRIASEVAERYLAARFGASRLSEDELARLRAQVRKL